jgi:arylsulfatase A-like enzyme
MPWFLYLSYNCPHGPLEAKENDISKYQDIKNKGRRTYCAMVDNLDQNVGRLIEKLKQTDQLENTVIIFLNDNGGSVETINALNAPFWGTKGTLYEGGIRVPMFIYYPPLLKASKYNNAVSSMDILPTALNFAQSPVQDENKYDGVDLLPFLTDNKQNEKPHKQLFWRMMYRGNAMLDGDWKYIQTPHDLPQLYNIKEDPAEQNNLAAQFPEKVQKMMNEHFTWSTTFKKSPMWMDSPYWLKMNRNIHRKQFQLQQP